MFNVGDLIIYSGQGICHVDEICEKTLLGEPKNYYVLHPVQSPSLTINIPVDNDKIVMLDIVDKSEAEKIIESFKQPGVDWIGINSQRNSAYSKIVKEGNRDGIAKVINTLMRKKLAAEAKGKKLYEQDNRILDKTQSILFAELAMSLNSSFEEISQRTTDLITESERQLNLAENFKDNFNKGFL